MESTPFDEKYWISRAKENREDFAPIYDHYVKRIYRYFSFKVGKLLAEDLTQQTFLKAMSRLDSFREESLFFTWLFQIAKYTLMDEQRKQKRRPRECELDSLSANSSACYAEYATTQLDLTSALQQINEIEREIIMLRFFGECTFAEIAQIMQMGESAVKNRLYRALEKVKGNLRGSEDSYEAQFRRDCF
ncbi:RNA polymerase sigma factor [Brevibacillus brevis]|uniref:RNA polymerase sigma factor n=1 Tax=Brevibacillus brevis TaxID=1393 RepID=UPI001C8DD35E|nr:RNA polymerase sigma factor [Brevibacillus brevis]MBY0085341.1 RNA polymerase sigma factor [Brevibacillus brevis]